MGKHYCDYCDVYLTHDSTSVRKAHNSGRNHVQNIRDYYLSFDQSQLAAIYEDVLQEYIRRGIPKPPPPQPAMGGPFSGPGGGGGTFGGNSYGGGFRPPSGYGRPPPPPSQGNFGNGPPPTPPSGSMYNRPPPNMSGGFGGPPSGVQTGSPQAPNQQQGPVPLGMKAPPPNFSQPPPGYGRGIY